MPFTSYNGHLNPETLSVLQAAFDKALAEIIASNPDIDEHDIRDLVAKRIIDATLDEGERDLEQLRRHAVAAFKSRRRRSTFRA